MRDYRDSKTMAKALRRGLEAHSLDLTHSQSLELIAQAFGFDNWNVLAAKIEADRLKPADARPPGEDKPLHCGFCGKSQHDVRLLIAGPDSFICNECVTVCDDVVEDNEVERHLKAASPDADPVAALESYLAERTSAQLAAYLERTGKRMAEAQQALAGIDAGDARMPDWLRTKDASTRAKARARFVRQLAVSGKAVEVVERVLAERT